MHEEVLTIHTRIVGFYKGFFDLTVFDHKRIAFTPMATEYGATVEGEVESAREFAGRVCKEANLWGISAKPKEHSDEMRRNQENGIRGFL